MSLGLYRGSMGSYGALWQSFFLGALQKQQQAETYQDGKVSGGTADLPRGRHCLGHVPHSESRGPDVLWQLDDSVALRSLESPAASSRNIGLKGERRVHQWGGKEPPELDGGQGAQTLSSMGLPVMERYSRDGRAICRGLDNSSGVNCLSLLAQSRRGSPPQHLSAQHPPNAGVSDVGKSVG